MAFAIIIDNAPQAKHVWRWRGVGVYHSRCNQHAIKMHPKDSPSALDGFLLGHKAPKRRGPCMHRVCAGRNSKAFQVRYQVKR